MGTMDAVAGVKRMLLGGNLAGVFQCVTHGAVGIGPLEIVVIADAQVSIRIAKSGVGEIEIAVEDTCHHSCARIGLRKVGARIEACGVHLLRGDIHLRTWHSLSLDAFDGVVIR